MTSPILLAFCSPTDREHIRDASGSCPVAYWGDALGTTRDIILLAVGPQGGASLALWIEVHGLERVVGVGLAGVTAAWAERPRDMKPPFAIGSDGRRYAQSSGIFTYGGRIRSDVDPDRLPLRPLEPLRKVAERARRGDECTTDGCGAVHHEYPVYCDECNMGQTFALKFVVACAPDDGVCATCGGTGRVPRNASNCIGADHECDVCDGTGKALSSAQVASELVGVDVGSTTDSMASGGTWVDVYSSNVALADHGLRSVIESLTR